MSIALAMCASWLMIAVDRPLTLRKSKPLLSSSHTPDGCATFLTHESGLFLFWLLLVLKRLRRSRDLNVPETNVLIPQKPPPAPAVFLCLFDFNLARNLP